MNYLVTNYLNSGTKSTQLTSAIRAMDRTQAKNLIDSLAAELYWFKKNLDFMKMHTKAYRARLKRLYTRLQKMLKRDVFAYEMLNNHYVERHFCLCFQQFQRLFINGTDFEQVYGNDTLHVVYSDPEQLKILYYIEGDVIEMTGINADAYHQQLKITAEDFN